MAENYAITMTEKNDVDYDNLFPQTVSPQVLLDANARATQGLATGATLNDSITDIVENGGASQVGDTLITARTNLGDKWLLENGAILQKADYPELAQVTGTTLGSKIQGTAVVSNIVGNKYFSIITKDKDNNLLFAYTKNNIQTIAYPFNTIVDTAVVGDFSAPVYDSATQKYYTGLNGTSDRNADLYAGETLDSLAVVTSNAFYGGVRGAIKVNGEIYFDVYTYSGDQHQIYKKSSTDDTVTRILRLGSTTNPFIKFMYTDGTNGYVLTTNNAVKPTAADMFVTNSPLGNITFASYSSTQTGSAFPTNDMSQYNGVIGLCGHIPDTSSVQTWITKDRENWIKIPSGITGNANNIVTAVMTANKFFYSVALGGKTSIYQIDITGITYNPVLSYTLQDTLTHGIYDDANNRIYYTNTAGNIYSFTIDDGILLPKFSPGSGGLYAYMKVKP
nr:MAG TPA: hypothetical protein [Caudoviricetes sp.]